MLAVMFAVALVGNSLVMRKLWQKWGKRGRMTIISFNLTLADLLVVLITILGKKTNIKEDISSQSSLYITLLISIVCLTE
ncbi:hypothetical protein SK128_001065 [Halocaridina rubra]|uniref:Uncharacterized protein n=1 Tax=Halocaridina rubra TaxID=373956 RepID=A0AAN8ZTR1_HALRR